jgi:hypothetical protein
MTDKKAAEENNVQIGTSINGTQFNANGVVNYVFGVLTEVPSIDAIEARGGPGLPGYGLVPGSGGGAGVRGYGGSAGESEGEIAPPGPGVVGQGGTGSQGAAGVLGYGTGSFDGVAGYGDPDGTGTGAFGQGSPGAAGVRGIGGGGPNTDPPGPAGVYGQGGPHNPGVVGQAGSAPADGVQGYGTGNFSGVAGFGDPEGTGTGVFGLGRGPGAQGVRGIGSGGPNVLPGSPVGVYGQGGSDGAAGVWGAGGIGVLAQGTNTGVVAEGATVGVNGQGQTGVVAASNGQPGSIGLFGSGNAADQLAGEFLGDVFIIGDFTITGLKSAVVPVADGSHRRLYCVESPESWFEDVGFGTLVNGRAEISLDPGFASTVQTDQYHVFITEYDGSNGLYVTARSATGFEVRAGAGAVDASFSYRVMAKRKDIQGARLEEVELPTPPQIGVDPLAEGRPSTER